MMDKDVQGVTGELKACPFCNWPLYPGTLDDGSSCLKEDGGAYWVECPDCYSQGPLEGMPAEAITAWNTRLASQPTRVEDAVAWMYERGDKWTMHKERSPELVPAWTETPLYTHPTPDTQTAAIGAEALEVVQWVAARRTVDEVIHGDEGVWPKLTVEGRIAEMGRRKREHDAMVMKARAILSQPVAAPQAETNVHG